MTIVTNSLAVAGNSIRVSKSIQKSKEYLLAQMESNTLWESSDVEPTNPNINRLNTGTWSGTFTTPQSDTPGLIYTPVLIEAPQYFPIVPGQPATFTGRVDYPFYTMNGWAGVRDMVNPSPPPDFIVNPATVYADGGVNWGSYFIIGTVNGSYQFRVSVTGNATWVAEVANPPAGNWSFQLITYANATDYTNDTNRILIGNPWLQTQRPGAIQQYYTLSYTPQSPQFSNVVISGSGTYTVAGNVNAFTTNPGYTYQILITEETDVEYAWALEPVAGAGAFSIVRSQPIGGPLKLRLVEQLNGCSTRVVGQVWDQQNSADPTAYPDMRIDYKSITNIIPSFPNATYPAKLNGTWSATLIQYGISRVSLVDINTKRVYGEYTMKSGLLRSFNVPPQSAGQTPADVFYSAFNDTCFLYDQAVALIAFLQLGERDAAKLLVDALLVVQNPNGSYAFANNQSALFEHNSGFIRNGAIAWVCYALLLADQPQYRSWWTDRTNVAAINCLTFLLTYMNTLNLINGGKGQYVDGVLDPDYVIPWWSCEHNIDMWWCLDLAYILYNDPTYNTAANNLKTSLLTNGIGWDPTSNIFWQGGTVTAGVNTPDGMHALDMMSWGGVLLNKWGMPDRTQFGISRAYNLYYVTNVSMRLSGFTTFVPEDGYPSDTIESPWYEGSYGMAATIRTQNASNAAGLMSTLSLAQNSDGSYPYTLAADPQQGITTFPGIIGPAWSIVAYAGNGTPYSSVMWN